MSNARTLIEQVVQGAPVQEALSGKLPLPNVMDWKQAGAEAHTIVRNGQTILTHLGNRSLGGALYETLMVMEGVRGMLRELGVLNDVSSELVHFKDKLAALSRMHSEH